MTFYVDPWSIVNVSDVVTTTNTKMMVEERVLLINGPTYTLTFILYYMNGFQLSIDNIVGYACSCIFFCWFLYIPNVIGNHKSLSY